MVKETYKVANFEFNNQEDAERFNRYLNIFNEAQLTEIYLGYKNKIDYTVYAKRKFNAWQMEEIRLGLENKVDVSIYDKEYFD